MKNDTCLKHLECQLAQRSNPILLQYFLPIIHQLVRHHAKPFDQRSLHEPSGCHYWREGHPAPFRTVCLLIAISLARWLGKRHIKFMLPRICHKTWLLVMTLILGISLIGKAQENSEEVAPLKAGYHEIKSKQASGILKKHKDVVILDIRTEKEYTAGHIQKAKWLDYYQDDFKAKLATLDRKKPYLVHCASGGRSGKSMQLFRDLGFTRVYHMNDGFRGWEKAKLPAEKGKPKSPAK